MFSSVTNYLWWGSGASEEVDENKATDTPTNENVELMTTSADHEWELVDIPGACHEDMEVSPLENLLIEHPSMSVYNMRVHSGKRKNKTQDTDSSENIDGPAAHTRSHHKKVGQPSHAPKRPKAVAARAGLIAQVEASSNKSGQRLQQLQKVGKSSKKSCDRQNKTRDFKSHGKHSNCNDRKMRPSGRMNIRAC